MVYFIINIFWIAFFWMIRQMKGRLSLLFPYFSTSKSPFFILSCILTLIALNNPKQEVEPYWKPLSHHWVQHFDNFSMKIWIYLGLYKRVSLLEIIMQHNATYNCSLVNKWSPNINPIYGMRDIKNLKQNQAS